MIGFTHVSIPCRDAERAGRWYRELFGFEELPAPRFAMTVRWFQVGALQLHLYERPETAAPNQHFGLVVEDFEAVYRKAEAMGALDESRGNHLFVTPAEEVQLYLRDPEGNNVEVNWPDARTLPQPLQDRATRRADQHEQSERNRSARLFAQPGA